MPSVCSKPSKSHSSNVKGNKINNDNNNSNNNDDDSNNSVWNHSKSIVGKTLASVFDYFFQSFMTLDWGAKLISCQFRDWLFLAFFVAQSFTIIGKSIFQLQLYVLLSSFLLMKCDRLRESHSSQFTQVVDTSDTNNNNSPSFYTTCLEDQLLCIPMVPL